MSTLEGSIVPLPTPFTGSDNRIDEAALRELIEYQIRGGSHGLGVAGTSGEPSSLSIEERKHLTEFVLAEVRGRVPVLPGTGSANLDETLELSRHAAGLGADALLVITPYYIRPNQNNLFEYYSRVAREVPDTPILIYNIPGRTAVNMEPETIGRLRRAHPNIVGIKQSTKNLDDVSYTFIHAGRDFRVFCGAETMTFPMLALGGAGHINATGAIAPEPIARIFELAKAGRWDDARDLHFQMLELNDILFIEVNPVPLKTGLAMLGLCERQWRLPLGPMMPENEAKLREVLARYGILEGKGARA